MSECNKDLCEKVHESIEDKLKAHDTRLINHSERIDKLEQYKSKSEEKIDNLCEQIKNFVSTLKWGFGITVTVTLFVLGYFLKVK